MRMHLARLDGVEFKEMPPVKDWSERLERAKTGIKSFASKQGGNIIELGDKIGDKVQEKGITDKIGGFFRRQSKKQEEEAKHEEEKTEENGGGEEVNKQET